MPGGELSFQLCTLKKLVFILVKKAILQRIIYHSLVGIRRKVVADALQSIEKVSSAYSEKSINAHVPDIGFRMRQPVSNVAVLEDLLSTRTVIRLVTDLYID
ncbi:hypothetical protein D3C71_1479790 [compost metagenome]